MVDCSPLILRTLAGFLISGSASSAYDADPWIERLIAEIRELHREQRRVVGVCFGHQIIGQALGGQVSEIPPEKREKSLQLGPTQVIRNPAGLSYGLRAFTVTPEGRDRLAHENPALSLFYHHADIVSTLPAGARLLGEDERCPVHGMAIEGHILTVQGHPEFDTVSGKQVLYEILRKEGLDETAWGREATGDSLHVAQTFFRFFEDGRPSSG
jgi:GMP synthase-like glutamine amidotransferase